MSRVALNQFDASLLAGFSEGLTFAALRANRHRVAAEGKVAQQEGAMSLVLEKAKDGWKIIHEHYSTKAPEQGD